MYFIAIVISCFVFIFISFTLIVLLLRQKSSLIFGIYPERGLFYFFKYNIAILIVRRTRSKIFTKQIIDKDLKELDKPQILSNNPKSYDVISFFGANSDGYKVILTIERRRRGILNVALYIWIPNRGLFSSTNLPDMIRFSTDGTKESDGFYGNDFKLYPIEYMKKWHLIYNGNLRKNNKLYSVSINFEFISLSATNYFDYNRDLSEYLIADSVAREAWNEEFFYFIRDIDNVLSKRIHYEQNGKLIGTLKLENDIIQLEINALRDHSFGSDRCLSNINRYVYFALFLNDGTNIVVGNLSQPSFFLSSLKVGFICLPNEINHYQSIIGSNYELYSYGEKGSPPIHQNFIIYTKSKQYFVQIEAIETGIRYVGGNWESKVYNQFVNCTVNGIKGHGITEYLYRNNSERPIEYSCNDPEWYKEICLNEKNLIMGDFFDEIGDSSFI